MNVGANDISNFIPPALKIVHCFKAPKTSLWDVILAFYINSNQSAVVHFTALSFCTTKLCWGLQHLQILVKCYNTIVTVRVAINLPFFSFFLLQMNTSTVPSKNGDYGVCRTICDIHNLGLSSLRSYHSFIRFFSMAEVFAYLSTWY